MGFAYTTTGATDRSSIVRGDVGFVSGTWTSSAVTEGTIVTGGSIVLGYGLTVGSAGITSGTAKVVLSNKNTDYPAAVKTTKNGYIGIEDIDPSNTTGGDWYAIVRL